MGYLVKITEKYYKYTSHKTGCIYTLNHDARGINCAGEAYYLKVFYPGVTKYECPATFCTKDDWHGCYKQDYQGRIWTDKFLILAEANKLIDKMEEA